MEGETQTIPPCQVSQFDLPKLRPSRCRARNALLLSQQPVKKCFCFLDKLQKHLSTTPPHPIPCEPSTCRERNSGKHHSDPAYHTHPRGKQNMSSSRLVVRPGPRSQLLRQKDTICSSLNIRQLAASFLPNFLGTCVASGKALHLPELLVGLSLWEESICLTRESSGQHAA